ncbi:MAG: flagellar motor switch protein FliN [Alphaproteobacteria bacterium]|nr:flagellar motor switch protein FliN [Alphaproteobacteria bacterium]
MSDDNTDDQIIGELAEAGAPNPSDNKKDFDLDEIQESPSDLEEDDFEDGEAMAKDVTAIYDIPVQVSAVLGRSSMQVSQLLKLGRGAVVELDRKVGEAIDIYVNNRLVARGEVVVVEDKLGVTMTEIVKSDRGGEL